METDSAKRNKISPLLQETLQMLKYSLKKERLNFTAGWSTSESELMNVKRVHFSSLVDDANAFDGVLHYLEGHGEN
jgi:hypothetical protein